MIAMIVAALSIEHQAGLVLLTPFIIFLSVGVLVFYWRLSIEKKAAEAIVQRQRDDDRIIMARGGLKKVYSKFFETVERMPDATTFATGTRYIGARYTNDSGQKCKFNIRIDGTTAIIEYYIFYENEWVPVQKTTGCGCSDGASLLSSILLTCPDCGLYN